MFGLRSGIVFTAIVVLFLVCCVNGNCSLKLVSFAIGVACFTAFFWGMYAACLGIKEDRENKSEK